MDWRAKVELFELLRREFEFGVGTVLGVAKKFGVHRRMVRQAIEDALPPQRKRPLRHSPKLDPVKPFIDSILEADRRAPRKQRHTAHRIYIRIGQETSWKVSEPTVRRYVRERKRQLGLATGDIYIPQSYNLGQEAQVDWYEAFALLESEQLKVHIFSMRSMASGAAFHLAFPRATQQAFLLAHEEAFHYFGGVFHTLRYDNLSSAVKKILRGYSREQNARFIAFRSHWRFSAEFCSPAQGHEKGGVEGEVGFFRRNHLVPVPQASDFADLNRQLLDACLKDQQRRCGQREQTVGVAMIAERDHLLGLAQEPFDIAEVGFPTVDSKGCVRVRNNFYSTPLKARTRVRVLILPTYIEVWHEASLVARHERCYSSCQQILDLQHYLDVLERKPGALAGSTPLKQWREKGRWPESFDQLWESLIKRYGKQAGTRQMIELLQLGRDRGYERLKSAVTLALEMGCTDVAAVRYLMQAEGLSHQRVEMVHPGALEKYERGLPVVTHYDQLLTTTDGQEVEL